MRPEFRTAAREIAARSMVLLKNAGGVLPLSPAIGRLAVIGPLADDRVNMMGNWTGDGRAQDVVTVLEGIRAAVSPQTRVLHARGTSLDVKTLAATGRAASDQPAFDEALGVARTADAVVLVIGETGDMSGEAASRTSLDLPGRQLELAQAIVPLGKPVVVVLMNGRPLTIGWLVERARRFWRPGSPAPRRATRSPMCSSGRSTPEVSCPRRFHGRLDRRRSITTTATPGVRPATPTSTRRSISTRRGRRCIRSATA
jgi:beta-glucosidase